MTKKLFLILFWAAVFAGLQAEGKQDPSLTEALERPESVFEDSVESVAEVFEDLDQYIEFSSPNAPLPFLVNATPFILGALLLCLVFLMAFLPAMFIVNVIAYKKLAGERRFLMQLNIRLAPFLIDPKRVSAPIVKPPRFWSRKRLQRIILSYANNINRYFSGQISQNAIDYYRQNVPPSDIGRILSSMNDNRRASFIRQGILVPPRRSSALAMQPYLDSTHISLRLWSRILYLRHFRDEYIPLLASYRHRLSEFDKIIYGEFALRSAKIGVIYHFEPLLRDHQDESVLLFALEMMVLLKQRPEYSLLPFLVSDNLSVRSFAETLRQQASE